MRPKYSNSRITLVDKVEKSFASKIDKLQHLFYMSLLEHYEASLVIDGSRLKNTLNNSVKAQDLAKFERSFFEKKTSKVLSWMASKLIEVNYINRKYFKAATAASIAKETKKI